MSVNLVVLATATFTVIKVMPKINRPVMAKNNNVPFLLIISPPLIKVDLWRELKRSPGRSPPHLEPLPSLLNPPWAILLPKLNSLNIILQCPSINGPFAQSLRQVDHPAIGGAQTLILEILRCIPVVKIFAFLDLERNGRFLEGHKPNELVPLPGASYNARMKASAVHDKQVANLAWHYGGVHENSRRPEPVGGTVSY